MKKILGVLGLRPLGCMVGLPPINLPLYPTFCAKFGCSAEMSLIAESTIKKIDSLEPLSSGVRVTTFRVILHTNQTNQ